MKTSYLSLLKYSGITLTLFAISCAKGADYQFTTVGGSVSLNAPNGVTVDGNGNIYIAESSSDTVREITSNGALVTLAGTAGTAGAANGTGTNALFDFPQNVAGDNGGNVYVADTGNNMIRQISALGVVTTLAGTSGGGGGAGSGSVDGTGAAASFYLPYGVAADTSGNVYVADTFNHTIRKITSAGVVTTFAGSAGASGSSDGTGSAARFKFPRGVAVDSANNVYVADSANHTVRKISPTGDVTTLAGLAGSFGNADGGGATARFAFPHGIAVDSAQNVYVADTSNNEIRKITPAGIVTTLGGGVAGNVDGIGANALFRSPDGVAVDSAGVIYVSDTGNNSIRKGIKISELPVITGQPGSQVANAGSSVTFTADATGVPLPTYQWYKNSQAIGGATTGTYTIANVAASDAGSYTVAASNTAGTATSAVAVLTVVAAPVGSSKVLGDFDGDGKADLVWSNSVTGERSMWFLNGNTMSGGASLGVVPASWVVSATADFNGDGKGDVFLTNTVTGDRAMWLMNGSTITTNAFMGTVPTDWVISGTGDFNGDGKADLVWTNTVTGDRAMWLMNGSTVLGGGYLGTIPVEWTIGGVGDFNGDGKADIVWSNTITGERSMWFQNGSTTISGATLNTVPVAWVISGVGDFNGDGKADIFLTSTISGDRVIWLMNGSTITTNAFMGTVPVEWVISGTGDFNGDKKKDLFWTNTANGDRAMWLMNGSTVLGGGYMGTVPVEWKINN